MAMSKENRLSDKRLSQMIDDANQQYLAAGFPDLCALWKDRIDALTELQSLRADLKIMADFVRPLIGEGQNPEQASSVFAWIGMLETYRKSALLPTHKPLQEEG